ncbi:MAG TPA: SDR family oxidoreductase [Bryobacteraceae bacterium]|nr:SDR family oxidoreductase [Bryobacteraceae bacterium]
MSRLSKKIIVVTGAASGIGKAAAELCEHEGAQVVRLDRLECDVADLRSVEAAFAGIPRIDGLVNSAGVATRHPLVEQDEAGWDAVIDINLKGSYLCAQQAIPRMSKGGSIVHIASAVGLIGVRNRAAYTASKGALVALTRNMALDYAPHGIRVNCICPGFARTGLTKALFDNPERKARIEAMHPLGRMGEPEDIAKAVLFLLSEDASWITGIALPVDGGFSAGHLHDV